MTDKLVWKYEIDREVQERCSSIAYTQDSCIKPLKYSWQRGLSQTVLLGYKNDLLLAIDIKRCNALMINCCVSSTYDKILFFGFSHKFNNNHIANS